MATVGFLAAAAAGNQKPDAAAAAAVLILILAYVFWCGGKLRLQIFGRVLVVVLVLS
jgi:asparagine N-glycosylation enzyme membrane subunit Stt3